MSILGEYRGNSAPGQLVDSSGNGNTLSVIGTSVPNPATPTPPEGDRWLAGPAVTLSYLAAPAAVVTPAQGSVEGFFQSSLATEPTRAVDDILISFNGVPAGLADKFFLLIDSVAPLGQIRIYFFQLTPSLNFASYNFADAGTTHDFKLEWDGTGTRLYLDSSLVASTGVTPTVPTSPPTIAGWDFTGSSQTMDYGYLDNVIFSSAGAPAVNPALLDSRRRR